MGGQEGQREGLRVGQESSGSCSGFPEDTGGGAHCGDWPGSWGSGGRCLCSACVSLCACVTVCVCVAGSPFSCLLDRWLPSERLFVVQVSPGPRLAFPTIPRGAGRQRGLEPHCGPDPLTYLLRLKSTFVCDLHHSSQQPWIPNPLSEARDRTRILMDTSQVLTH